MVFPDFTGFTTGFPSFLVDLTTFTWFYWVLLGCTGLHWDLLAFLVFFGGVSLGFYCFLLGSTGF